jgi:hypothetical protein
MWLRQSTASQEILLGPFLDSTDGNTQETGLTIANTDIKVWKEGGTTESNKNSGGATHIANGRYYAVLDATDTNTLGKLEVNVHVAGALAVRREFMVLPAMIYDSLVLGTDRLDTNVTHVADTAQTAGDIPARLPAALVSGRIDASVGAIAANAITATAIASNAITSAKIATDAIGAAQIAANAIGASELASDAVTEIQSGLATSAALAVVDSIVDDILVDTGTTLPATLTAIAGYIDTEIGTLQTSVDDLPTNAELATALGTADDAVLSAVSTLQTSVNDLPTNAELATALGTADDAILAQVALVKAKTDLIPAVPASSGDAMTLTGGERTTLAGVIGTTAQVESYRADGATGSIAQLLYEATAHLGESSIAGTTKTINKIDGTTPAATFTLDDATNPTSITRDT